MQYFIKRLSEKIGQPLFNSNFRIIRGLFIFQKQRNHQV